MKVKIQGDKRKFLDKNLPDVWEVLDAILEGGKKLAEMKKRVAAVKEKVNGSV